MSTSTTDQTAAPRGERKVRQGVVVSDKMDKTAVVLVERRTTHPLYAKTVTKSQRYHAHDESNDVNVGDRVRIVETRPLSKTKRWRILDVVERAK
jgi:small subunit ribosomal protein S17